MKSATTPEMQRVWMAQWRAAAAELVDFKRQELQSLTEVQAWTASGLLLDAIEFPRPPSWRDRYSGLVEQQRNFRRGLSRR